MPTRKDNQDRRRQRREQVALERATRQVEREASYARRSDRRVFTGKVRRGDRVEVVIDLRDTVTVPFDGETDRVEDVAARAAFQVLLAHRGKDDLPN